MTYKYNECLTFPHDLPDSKEFLGVWNAPSNDIGQVVYWTTMSGMNLGWFIDEYSTYVAGWEVDAESPLPDYPPDYYDPNAFATQQTNDACTCEIFSLMNNGCPSSKGGACRSQT